MEYVITTYVEAESRDEAEQFMAGIVYPGPIIDTGMYEAQ